MASHIARRNFLATLGGAAAWPLVAHAQQATMPVVGFVNDHDAARRNSSETGIELGRALGAGMRQPTPVPLQRVRWA
jgi:hypothetical protein